MEIKVLEYKVWQGNKVKVKSYHYKKDKIVANPKYEFHKALIKTIPQARIFYKKEYKEELKKRRD